LLALAACKKDVGKLPVTTNAPVATNACDTVTYEKHIKGVLNAHCLYCHGSSGTPGPDFGNYGAIKERALNGKLKIRAIDGTVPSMPPSNAISKPTPAQLELLKCWINNGAKEK